MDMLRAFLLTAFLTGVILIMTGLGAYASINGYIDVKGQQDAIISGTIIDVQLTQIRSEGGRNNNLKDVCYEHYENGVLYYGVGVSGVNGYDKAKAYIGKTISIYIDGKGHSIPVGKRASNGWFLLTISIVFSTLFTAGVIATCIMYGKLIKICIQNLKERKRLKDVSGG
ncbi:MAG: hypothetical protein LBP26_00935 [Clostridiales bacterium]|jgi:hypothetical protein|nr:hypothetical protein [Clostridiales bacterium]